MSKPKAPKEDPSTVALRKQQLVDLSKLDEEENLRIKQLLAAQRGGRFFRGSPSMRQSPGNRAGPGGSGGTTAPSSGVTAPGSGGIVRGAGGRSLYNVNQN